MAGLITAVPVLRPRLFCGRRTALPNPLCGKGVSFWYSARAAIFQMVKALGLGPGSRILAPAYSCGSEIDALLLAGLDIDYYRIGPQLAPDLADLAQLCRRPAQALYVTHYFGFAQPMAELTRFAQERGMLVLEDNAHGLYSTDEFGHPLGTLGDAGVFSLTKSLPVPDGGALCLRGEAPAHPPRSRRPRLRAMAGRMKYLVKESMQAPPRSSKRPASPAGDAAPRARRRAQPSVMDLIRLPPERSGWGISPVARFLFQRTHHHDIPARRRENFNSLADMIGPGGSVRTGAKPIFSVLPPGCCPNFFPLVSDDPTSLHRHLRAHGVQTKRTWSYFHEVFPAEKFPFETRLKRSVVSLPVHQDLGREDMERIANAIALWRAGRGPP